MCLQCRRPGLHLGQEDLLEKGMATRTPVFLPGESHGQSSLAGYSPWGRKRVRHDLGTEQKQPLASLGSGLDFYTTGLRHKPNIPA